MDKSIEEAVSFLFSDVLFSFLFSMENLYINRFMHMFQSSWSDFADFERIFVRISNTISGRFIDICSHLRCRRTDKLSALIRLIRYQAHA